MIDFVLVKKAMLESIHDVKCLKVLSGGVSDHVIVMCKVKLKFEWGRKIGNAGIRTMIRVEKLRDAEFAGRYREKVKDTYEEREDDGNVSRMWNELKGKMLAATEEVCGTRIVGGRKRGTAWWSDELKVASSEKSKAWLKLIDARTRDEKKREKKNWKVCKKRMKSLVWESKDKVQKRIGKEINEDFYGNKNRFYMKIERERKGNDEVAPGRVKDANGNIVTDPIQKAIVYKKYWEALLNEADVGQAQVARLEFEGDEEARVLCESMISIDEVMEALKEMKGGKAAGVDNITPEIIKEGGEEMVGWMCKLFNKAFVERGVPEDWKKEIIAPVYKGKFDKRECKNMRGISMLSNGGKAYGRVLIKRAMRISEKMLEDEQR